MKTIALTILAATTAFAGAEIISSDHSLDFSTSTNSGLIPWEITIDISGMQFNGSQGSPFNEILSIFVGQSTGIAGIAWDVNLTTIGASWASEAVMIFEGQVNITVADDPNPVTNMNYNSGGFLYLEDLGIPEITVGADGMLDIEFYESFIDNAGTGDSFFEAGSTITITNVTPTPSTLAFLGMAGLISTRRRR